MIKSVFLLYFTNLLIAVLSKNIFFYTVVIISMSLVFTLDAENGISKFRFAIQLILHSACFAVVLHYERNYGAYINDYKIILAEIALLTLLFFANLHIKKRCHESIKNPEG